MKKKIIGIIVLAVVAAATWYVVRFYPQQLMPVGEPIEVLTPMPEKYHNDCLHPCIRQLHDNTYAMVQSPYYKWDNQVENPMFYQSCHLRSWKEALLLADTPETGYNSDPNIYVEDSHVYAFWRESYTPLSREMGGNTVIGGLVNDSSGVLKVRPYIVNSFLGGGEQGDLVQCPILIKHDGKYLFYAAWYQYNPERKNKGIAIWEGSSLNNPDFVLSDTILFDNPLICDKWLQKKLFGHILFIPKPKRYDLWHFDLFEVEGKLYMVSCAEKDDNIMLSVSEDWKHFKTIRKPLINNHYSENNIGYRQYYYKPTAIVQNDSLYLFYTANAQDDGNRNQLFLSVKSLQDLGIKQK